LGRRFFQNLALTRRKFLYQTSFLYDFVLDWLRHFDFDACFRSSTEETSARQGDRDRYQIRPHDSTLEQTADSQENAAGDAAPGDLLKPSPPPKKKMIEPELVLVSSSDEPSGPKSHVSPKILALRF
jgi:hypothetical protein